MTSNKRTIHIPDESPEINYGGQTLSVIAPVHMGTENAQLWIWAALWYPMREKLGWQYTDEARQENPPVVLALPVGRMAQAYPISMLIPLPPPQIGEYGLVEKEDGELAQYHIRQLPPVAERRQVELGKKLCEISASLLWPDFTAQRMLASDAGKYTETLLSIAKSLSGEAWPKKWQEVQQMAKQLADDYYQYHQLKRIPPPQSIFTNGIAKTPSCMPFAATMASIHAAASQPEEWVRPKDHAPYFRYGKKSGMNIIQYMTGAKGEQFNSETTESLYNQVKQFSDSSNDVLAALFAHFIRPGEPDGTIWFHASQYLDDRGLEPITKGKETAKDKGGRRRAGHRQERIIEVGRDLALLENIWITIDQTMDEEEMEPGQKKRKQRQFRHKGRLFMIEECITQKDLHGDSSSEVEIAWKIRPGSWLRPFLESPNRQVANLFQKSLMYDPYREQWEKRLSRYFMIFGHVDTRGGGGKMTRAIKGLLQEVRLPTDDPNNPKRIRDHFEQAMDKLAADRFISDWEYTEKINLPKRNWLSEWVKQEITIYIAPAKRLK